MTPTAIASALSLIGAPVLLRRGWARPDGGGWTIAGWSMLILALGMAGFSWGAPRGPAIALLALPLPALAVIILGRSPARQRRVTLRETGSANASRRWRGLVRAAMAVPLAGAGALALAALVARAFPTLEQSVVGGLILAILLWSAGMAWAVIDPRPGRVAIGLAAMTGLGAAALIIP